MSDAQSQREETVNSSSTANLVQLEKVSLRYGAGDRSTLAIDGIDLNIRRGEFVAVVGPSGCGKSTLMKILSGLVPVSDGVALVEGREIAGPLKSVGMAFQASNLLPWRNTIDNVMLPLEVVEPHKRLLRRERAAVAAECTLPALLRPRAEAAAVDEAAVHQHGAPGPR